MPLYYAVKGKGPQIIICWGVNKCHGDWLVIEIFYIFNNLCHDWSVFFHFTIYALLGGYSKHTKKNLKLLFCCCCFLRTENILMKSEWLPFFTENPFRRNKNLDFCVNFFFFLVNGNLINLWSRLPWLTKWNLNILVEMDFPAVGII